jgi:ABC-type branched-subunit amino acid transport system ATPase component
MLLAALVAVMPARWLPARLVRPPRPEPVPAVDRPTPPEPGPPGETVVECRSVARYYGGVHALEDVSLTVAGGELVGLVGPNGSGKTTLVNLLSGTVRPSRGTIAVAGQDTARLAPHRIAHAGVARTYQIPRPFDSMTVRDNVAMAGMFGRRRLPLAQARAEAGAHLETVSLTGWPARTPARSNLHQRQLLEMARAVASEPRVLLLDEAMAGLNPAEIDEAVEVIRRISAAGVTIVLVEHLLRVLNQLATRLVVLDRGRCWPTASRRRCWPTLRSCAPTWGGRPVSESLLEVARAGCALRRCSRRCGRSTSPSGRRDGGGRRPERGRQVDFGERDRRAAAVHRPGRSSSPARTCPGWRRTGSARPAWRSCRKGGGCSRR